MTAKDFRFDTFRAGGKGGQNQNKVESGVRCVHEESGATGIARDSRDQPKNRRNAFLRCVQSQKFKIWHKIECARRMGCPAELTEEDLQAIVDAQMVPKNLRIKYY